jgi:L-asparaginase
VEIHYNRAAIVSPAKAGAGAGVVNGGDMTAEAALTKLMYVPGCGFSPEQTREVMAKSLRGEISH